MVESLLRMAGLKDWPVPDFSTLCRRQKTVSIQIPFRRAGGPLNLLVDIEPVSATGSSEPARGREDARRRRVAGPQARPRPPETVAQGASGHGRGHRGHPWGGVHLQPDRRQPGPAGPSGADPSRPAHRHRHGRRRRTGTRTCHAAIAERGGTAVIPIRKNGRPWNEDGPAARSRNKNLRTTKHFGRAFWKRLTGYHVRSRIEAQMLRLKSFGERIASRDPDRQAAEIHTRIALMNRFSALGQAEITRVA
jgi:DDE family transposase